jgi:hypothetical protein
MTFAAASQRSFSIPRLWLVVAEETGPQTFGRGLGPSGRRATGTALDVTTHDPTAPAHYLYTRDGE